MTTTVTAPAESSDLGTLTWPTPAADVTPPIALDKLLQALQLLATDEARAASTSTGQKWDGETPASMQVIKSGALSITKAGTKWVAGAGGIAGLAASIGGTLTAVFSGLNTAVNVSLVAGGAVVLAAVAIALSLFVKGDLDARGVATAARHAGRAEVACAFLRATAELPRSTLSAPSTTMTIADQVMFALAAYPTKTEVSFTDAPPDKKVEGVRSVDDGHEIYADNDWKSIDKVRSYVSR